MKKALTWLEQNPHYWISYYQTFLLHEEGKKALETKAKISYWCKQLVDYKDDYKDPLYEIWKKREDEYIASQILKNRKWHNFWYFLRYLFTGKD